MLFFVFFTSERYKKIILELTIFIVVSCHWPLNSQAIGHFSKAGRDKMLLFWSWWKKGNLSSPNKEGSLTSTNDVQETHFWTPTTLTCWYSWLLIICVLLVPPKCKTSDLSVRVVQKSSQGVQSGYCYAIKVTVTHHHKNLLWFAVGWVVLNRL